MQAPRQNKRGTYSIFRLPFKIYFFTCTVFTLSSYPELNLLFTVEWLFRVFLVVVLGVGKHSS